MSENSSESNFFDWLVSLFQKPKTILPPEPTKEELEEEARWVATKAKYRLEYLDTYKLYFVQYFHNGQWYWLRRWDEDYVLEKVRGNALRISDPNELDSLIKFHQDWIKDGHIFLNFD